MPPPGIKSGSTPLSKLALIISFFALTMAVFANFSAGTESSVPPDMAGQQDALAQRLDRLEKHLDDLGRDLAQLQEDRRTEEGIPSPGTAKLIPVPVEKRSAGESGDDSIDERIRKEVDARMQGVKDHLKRRNAFGQWEASMKELQAELSLDEGDVERLQDLFNAHKDEHFDLFSIANDEGVNQWDRMAADFREGLPPKTVFERFFRRFQETIPGSDETYASRLKALEVQMLERLSEVLDDERMGQLKKLNLALGQMKTGYDPAGSHIRQLLGGQ